MPEFSRRLAAERPEEIAVRDETHAFTWGQLDDALNRVGNGILAHFASLGASAGDGRVAVFAENAVETALSNLGGLIAGRSVVPVNFHLTAEEVAYILGDAGVRLLFAGGPTAERAVQAAKEASRQVGEITVVAWDADGVDTVQWNNWLAAQPSAPPPDDHAPQPNLLYTSGTTGRPKGTELPPTMFAGGATVLEHLDNLALNPMREWGVHMVVGPMYHTGPLSGARLLAAGVPSVILGKFDAEKTLATIEKYSVGSSVMVPTHFVRLLALPEDVKARYSVSSLVRMSHTGAKCPVDVKRAMIQWWGPVFTDAYGASEVGTTCMITSEEWLEHPGSVGRSVPPFEAVVLDDSDQPVPANTEGRLYFKDSTGRGVVYHNDPEKSAAAHIAPGVFTLGEIAYMDEDGYVYITDRFSDMVLSGGVNLYPAEAEQVLIEHPAVLDVACIGVPHPEMGEELKALAIAGVDAANAPSGEEMIAWCRERLSHYKCPRTFDWVDDLGRNTMGKINKRKLRAPYWEGHS